MCAAVSPLPSLRPQRAGESYEAHRTQLSSQLATAQQCLEELRGQCLEDIGLLQRRHAEEVAALQQRLEAAAGACTSCYLLLTTATWIGNRSYRAIVMLSVLLGWGCFTVL